MLVVALTRGRRADVQVDRQWERELSDVGRGRVTGSGEPVAFAPPRQEPDLVDGTAAAPRPAGNA